MHAVRFLSVEGGESHVDSEPPVRASAVAVASCASAIACSPASGVGGTQRRWWLPYSSPTPTGGPLVGRRRKRLAGVQRGPVPRRVLDGIWDSDPAVAAGIGEVGDAVVAHAPGEPQRLRRNL